MTTDASATMGAANTATPATTPKAINKSELLIKRLKRKKGMSLAALSDEFGWLPHTTRAALSRLRKAGHTIIRVDGSKGSSYRSEG